MWSLPKIFGPILFLVFIASINSIHAQSQPQRIYEYENINIFNDKNIKNALYDSEQNLWLYTENGIYRKSKNNSKIKQYFVKDSWNVESSILFGDSQKRIWFCDERKDSILRYILQDTVHSIQLPFQIRISSIIEKPADIFWISTVGNGLLKLHYHANNKWTYHFYDNSNKIPLDIYSAFTDHQKNIYLITRKGLVNWDATNQISNFIPIDLPKNTQLSFGTTFNDSILLLGTWGNGLFKLNLFTNKLSPWQTTTTLDNSQIFISGINKLENEILISTWGNGCYLYRNKQIFEFNSKSGLSGNKIYNFIKNSADDYLVLQKQFGITRIQNPTLLKTLQLNQHIGSINSTSKISNGEYLLCSNGGINIFSNNNSRNITDNKLNFGSAHPINQHESILMSYGDGLLKIDLKSEKISPLLSLPGKSNYYISSIKDGHNDSIIWTGSLEGLMRFNFISGIKFFSKAFSDHKINRIAQLDKEQLLVNSEDSGLFLYSIHQDIKKAIVDEYRQTIFATSFKTNAGDETYFATNKGEIYLFQNNKASILKICQSKDKSKINFFALKFNKILIGDDIGLSLFDIQNKNWIGLNDQYGGIFKKKIFPINYTEVGSEEIVFINESGFCTVTDSVFFMKSIKPEFILDSIYIAGVKSKSIENDIEIKYNESIDLYLNFSNAAIPENIKVEYRLQENAAWNSSDNNKHLLLTNLPTGNFQLSIRYSLDGYNWETKELATLSISLPWYLNFTFYIYLVLFLIFLTIAIYRRKIESIKIEERKKTLHAQQLAEQEMKVLRSQMNPHFIFNALNSIHNCILQKDPLTAANSLTKFARLVRNILDNSMHNTITLNKELKSLELYIQVEKLRFDKNLNYSIAIDPSLDLDTLQIPPLVLQPFVENSIWHGLIPSEREGEIQIKLQDTNDLIKIFIRDNGIGRKKSAALKTPSKDDHVSYGLDITIDRLKKFNGGSKEISDFKIIDLKNELNEAIGTEVQFSLKKTENKVL